MSGNSWLFLITLFAALFGGAWVLGAWIARLDGPWPGPLQRWLAPLERWVHRVCGIDPAQDMDWRRYARAVLAFHLLCFLSVYLLQRLQGLLPLNPQALGAVRPDLAFNTAMSFATNTNWQSYGGETTLSNLTQMLGLGVQNFTSAAAGLAVLLAVARGFGRGTGGRGLGSFWVDLVRVTLHLLLPLSLVLALFLISQGVVQSFAAAVEVPRLEPALVADGGQVTTQWLPLGPAASQVAIKQLGTNGGGFFNVNSAHPLENPTAFSNWLQTLALLLLPGACCFAFGRLVRDRRQGRALLAAMTAILLPLLALCIAQESLPHPDFAALGVDASPGPAQPGGNMEGKEARFGPLASAIWATFTTAASNGSVNSMHASFQPLGSLVPMVLMQLGEVVFGGVGSGLYGMLLFVLIAVFVAGLMVGRTPEYLGKKIEAYEVKMASLGILIPCASVLLGTALSVATDAGRHALANPGPRGFAEALYAFSSASNNNGSAFAGISANVPLLNAALGACMFLGRFPVMLVALAIAGAVVRKPRVPPSAGTLPTHGPLFGILLVAVLLAVGALTFLPALCLGPIVEHLRLESLR